MPSTLRLRRLAVLLVLTVSSVHATPVLISRDTSGAPGTAASGTGIFGSPVQSPVTDTGVVYFLSSAALAPLRDENQVIDVYRWDGTQTEPWSIGGSGAMAVTYGNCRSFRLGEGGNYAVELRPANELDGIVRPFLWEISGEKRVDSGIPDTVSVDSADVSADGRYVVCATSADELDISPSNGLTDVFRFDRELGERIQISLTPDGDTPDAASGMPRISSGGNLVVFLSKAVDLTDVSGNGNDQAYVWDDGSGSPCLCLLSRRLDMSVTSGAEDVALSADGSHAVFVSEDPGVISGDEIGTVDVFLVDVAGGDSVRVSVGSDGQGSDGTCSSPALNADGRFVVFCSPAVNLVSVDTHSVTQIYCRDMAEERTILISSAADGNGADAACSVPAISPSGRYVTFVSAATNLSDESTDGVAQVYRVDRGADFANHSPTALSRHIAVQSGSSTTLQLAGEDPDGDVLSFIITSLPDGCVVYDGDGTDSDKRIQADEVPFTVSDAAAGITVVPDADFAGVVGLSYTAFDGVSQSDAAVVEIAFGDFETGIVASVTTPVIGSSPTADALPDGTPGRIGISDSGQRVAFSSASTNLTDGNGDGSIRNVIAWDDSRTIHEIASTADPGATESTSRDSDDCTLSPDGRFVVFKSLRQLVSGDTNVYADIYLRDLETDETLWISRCSADVPADGNCRSPDIAADGAWVVFSSTASNLAAQDTGGIEQIYLWEKETKHISLISIDQSGTAASSPCLNPRISADGTTLVFESAAALTDVSGDGTRHIFIYRRPSGQMAMIETTVDGAAPSGDSLSPVVSQGGRYIVFASDADNLTTIVTGGCRGIYLYDAVVDSVECLSQTPSGAHADRHCFSPAVSGDGRFVYFRSMAANLTSGVSGSVMGGYRVDRSKAADDPDRLRLVSHALGAEGESNGDSWNGALSQTGRYVAFASDATDLVGHDANSYRDIYRCDFGVSANNSPSAADCEVEVVQGETATVVLSASDADADDLVFRIAAVPDHGSLTGFDASVSPGHNLPTVLYTPEEGYERDDQFTFTVSDGAVTVSCCVTLQVSPLDQPAQLQLTESRLLILIGSETVIISYELFMAFDPDGTEAPTGFTIEILSEPVAGTLRDASGALVSAGSVLTSSGFPLVYTAADPDVAVLETVVFRASLGGWVSESVSLDIAVGVVQQELGLNAGWNLVSFQLTPLDAAPATLLGSLAGADITGPIWAWDTETETYYEPDELGPGTGYWLFAESATDTPSSVPGYPVTDPGVLLLPGWNAVGPVGLAETGDFPDLEETGISIIWEWSSETQSYAIPDMLRSGHGYWLKAAREEVVELRLENTSCTRAH